HLHRSARLDLVTVRVPSLSNKPARVLCFVGLLTSKSISQEASSIPLIRRKLNRILEQDGYLPNSHDYKEIISITDSMPKADLLRFSIERLREEIALVFNIQRRSETRVGFSLDPLKRFISCSVVLPKDKFSGAVRQRIQEAVERRLGAQLGSSEYSLSVSDYPLVVLRLLVPNPSLQEVALDAESLQRTIAELTLTWDDKLLALLIERHSDAAAHKLFGFYRRAFPEQYKTLTDPRQSLVDIGRLERLDVEHPLELSLEAAPDPNEPFRYRLRLYKRGESLTLSAILPYLENAGFDILSETVTSVATEGSVWAAIYELMVQPMRQEPIDETIAATALLPGLALVLSGDAENDSLNQLMLCPGLRCEEVAVLRALAHYLWQIKATTSDHTIAAALVQNPALARLLFDYFNTRFSPDAFPDAAEGPVRTAALVALREEISRALKSVELLLHDRALRSVLNVIEATVRTNYYQANAPFRVALKIECSRITEMPTPRPLFETFVSSPDFEGVHLRGGRVARGGIRWSDRVEDYRTEVLGLMKTQMVKNSIIVPVGAKGGFIVKKLPRDPKSVPLAVETAYKGFIRSLLELADNRVENAVVPPQRTVIYDTEDPYLVVAADRGTATFSDTANKIAQEQFGFWLADAFASGGSAGYDHKKYGITARGAWEAVCRHFREIGIEVASQEFTVTGIGDMSGDVFGNGLLLSDNAKLIAAFNHRHIFIDPNPNSKVSFAERKRLFALPHSQWTDYNSDLLSAGGAIFQRSAKEITLSDEAKAALGTTSDVVSGEELVRIILKAPVDLLWNGGIGTYVKAHEETNLSVGDRANDDVRVDARDLRVRVIGEGGNLGLTQRARIEYSRIGGHCNTDAVDNSGGVDLSDLEVNLKILLAEPVRRGELSIAERNELLMSCADEACLKVVGRNRTQSKGLSLAVRRSRRNIGYYRGLIDSLEKEGLLDRAKEALPDDETLVKRSSMKAGLTRPELAVLSAYTKMSLYRTIIESDLPEDPFLQRFLTAYFPRSIAQRYPQYVASHPLRREIIATQIANLLAERMGGSFVYRSAEETGLPRTDIIRAFLAADAISDAREITEKLVVMDRANSTRAHLQTLLRVQTAIDSMTRWLLEHRNPSLTLVELVDRYREPFGRLVAETDNLITEVERTTFQETTRQLLVNDVPKEVAKAVAAIAYASAYLDIVDIAAQTQRDVLEVAHLYSQLALVLQIRHLLEQVADIEPADRWEALALRTLSADLRGGVAALTKRVVEQTGRADSDAMQSYLHERRETIEQYRSSLQEFNNRTVTIPALLVMTNQLAALSRSF
ncbi:MAG: NAD-glutamate dehydrogenase, partial [Bdellovibrionales bacterium]|nr:NAD-glutamate dehydrogenase [Bdellovibrionales bacterium]